MIYSNLNISQDAYRVWAAPVEVVEVAATDPGFVAVGEANPGAWSPEGKFWLVMTYRRFCILNLTAPVPGASVREEKEH